ncbi:hypothetical protein [Maritalea sp. S77]|uniref:hypothetical protein n=1 Tax=Maritalea sp. S77 TaxID=3415125 RepID=UPI003C7977BE
MRLTWLGKKVLRLEVGLEHFLIAKTKQNFTEVDIGRNENVRQLAFDEVPEAPFKPFDGQEPAQKPKRMIDEDGDHDNDLFLQGENFLLIDRVGTERLIVAIDGLDTGILPAEWVTDAIVIIAADERDELIKSFKEIKAKKSIVIKPRHYLLAIPAPDEELFERFVCAVGDSPAQILEPGYAVEL